MSEEAWQELDIFLKRQDGAVGMLLTSSATTGWMDWIHGDLWLFPHGLLRVPLGVWVTQQHGVGPTVDTMRRVQCFFDNRTLEGLLSSSENVWVARVAIQRAYLHRGLITDRLRLVVGDQRTVKFLWLPWDGAWQILQSTLAEWLGDGLIID
jgi:hypothetical protein